MMINFFALLLSSLLAWMRASVCKNLLFICICPHVRSINIYFSLHCERETTVLPKYVLIHCTLHKTVKHVTHVISTELKILKWTYSKLFSWQWQMRTMLESSSESHVVEIRYRKIALQWNWRKWVVCLGFVHALLKALALRVSITVSSSHKCPTTTSLSCVQICRESLAGNFGQSHSNVVATKLIVTRVRSFSLLLERNEASEKEFQ